ncbi:MAG: hypothetical protein U9Q72_02535 [Patescibacteria group bacterium]|nr:hypothetical protein [Patescibacteria group bacterium]
MNKFEQASVSKTEPELESPTQKDNEEITKKKTRRVKQKRTKKVKQMFMEEIDTSPDHIFDARRPSLDYYDNKRDHEEKGGDIHYQGKYGKWEED